MEFLEDKNIKTKILCWENDYLDLIKSDIFMYNRFISFDYRGEEFDSIRILMERHPHLSINSDYDNFIDPPKDHHPSKECHRIIAKSVIASINNDLDNSKNFTIFDGAAEAISNFRDIRNAPIKKKVRFLI